MVRKQVVVPYTYLAGNRISLTEYYRQTGVVAEDCPLCHQAFPRFGFRSRNGVWVCGLCAWRIDQEQWRKRLDRLS